MDPRDLFIQADQLFERYASPLTEAHWQLPVASTPEWTVRDLIEHVITDDDWVPDLLAGRKVSEVADHHDVDPFDGDIKANITAMTEGAQAAVAALPELDQSVHLSFGDEPAWEYLLQMTGDRLIHAWDLARATGQDAALPVPLVEAVWEYMQDNIEEWRDSGLFGPAVAIGDDAVLQDRLIALTGRDPYQGMQSEPRSNAE